MSSKQFTQSSVLSTFYSAQAAPRKATALLMTEPSKLETDLTIIGSFVVGMWLLWFLSSVVTGGMIAKELSLRPRESMSPLNFIAYPFIHFTFAHVAGNTIPFAVLGWLVMLTSTLNFWIVTVVTIISNGLGTWLLGTPQSRHAGASGLVLGYYGFLVANLFFDGSLNAFLLILLTLIVGSFYGGFLRQILPTREGISTSGHFFGFVGGIAAAYLLHILPTIGGL